MISFLFTIVKLLIILGVVATIHEFGHFIFAKLFKMGVEEFSIGFGPKIIQKKYKNTVYSLRWIPLGGYCAIEGEEGDSDSESAFSNKSPVKRIIVLLAGATFNAILATVIFISLGLSFPKYSTTITEFAQDSVLEAAGVRVGDTITKIDSKNVKLQSEIGTKNVYNQNNDITITYLRDGKEYTTVVKDAIKDSGYIGVSFDSNKETKEVTTVIDMVASGGAASKAGLKSSDKIIKVAGIEVKEAKEVVETIRSYPSKEIEIVLLRDGKEITKKITPDTKRVFDLGIISTEKVKPTFSLAIRESINTISSIVGSYIELFKGKVNINEMSGIVGIGEVVSKTTGIIDFLNLMGVISLAIGVANIMPFPPLDGGKIVLVLWEAITRKKVPVKVEAVLSYIGFALLIALTIFVTYNDIIRII